MESIGSNLKELFKDKHSGVYVWKIKKNGSLVKISKEKSISSIFSAKHAYLIGRFFKAKTYGTFAPTMAKLKLHFWIGSKCTHYQASFSPVVQFCRTFSRPVELFADFQFNESFDLLSYMSTQLKSKENASYLHPLIFYSFTSCKPQQEYYILIHTMGKPEETKYFSSITQLPACTKENFPECTYIKVKQNANKRFLSVLKGAEAPNLHASIVAWLKSKMEAEKFNIETEECNSESMTEEWHTAFSDGNFAYLDDRFWEGIDPCVKEKKDFLDSTTATKEEETPGEDKKNIYQGKAFRIFLEAYGETIKGCIDAELKKMKGRNQEEIKFSNDWKLHFKTTKIQNGKYLDAIQMLIFEIEKYNILWIGSMVPLFQSKYALAILQKFMIIVGSIDLRHSPYFLRDEFEAEKPYFLFVFQGIEPYRFKSIFTKWISPQPNYYNIPRNIKEKLGFTSEDTSYSSLNRTKINLLVDPAMLIYSKCFITNKQQEKKNPFQKILGFPYSNIYGFKGKNKHRNYIPVLIRKFYLL